jgi:hypothetical protein
VGLGDLGGGLDAGEAVADHGDRRPGGQLVEPGGELLGRGRPVQRVGVGLDAGDAGQVRGAADGVHQGVVAERRGAGVGGDGDGVGVGVDGLGPALQEIDPGPVEQVGDLEVLQLLAGGPLVHPQPFDEPGCRVDQGDPATVATGAAGGPDGGDHAGVAGAQDDDVVVMRCLGHGPSVRPPACRRVGATRNRL